MPPLPSKRGHALQLAGLVANVHRRDDRIQVAPGERQHAAADRGQRLLADQRLGELRLAIAYPGLFREHVGRFGLRLEGSAEVARQLSDVAPAGVGDERVHEHDEQHVGADAQPGDGLQRVQSILQQGAFGGACGQDLAADPIGQLLAGQCLLGRDRIAVGALDVDHMLGEVLPRHLQDAHALEPIRLRRVVDRHLDQVVHLRGQLRLGDMVRRQERFLAGHDEAARTRLHIAFERGELVELADHLMRVVDPARHRQVIQEERDECASADNAHHERQRDVAPGDAIELVGVDGGSF
jgi:hypothetical protein